MVVQESKQPVWKRCGLLYSDGGVLHLLLLLLLLRFGPVGASSPIQSSQAAVCWCCVGHEQVVWEDGWAPASDSGCRVMGLYAAEGSDAVGVTDDAGSVQDAGNAQMAAAAAADRFAAGRFAAVAEGFAAVAASAAVAVVHTAVEAAGLHGDLVVLRPAKAGPLMSGSAAAAAHVPARQPR